MEDLTLDSDLVALRETAGRCMAECPADDTKAAARHLAAAGLFGVLAAEAAGGLELDMRAAVLVTEAAGEALLAFPILEALLAAQVLQGTTTAAIDRIINGEIVVTIAWRGCLEAHGPDRGKRLSGRLSNIPFGNHADYVIARLRHAANKSDRLVMIDLSAPGVVRNEDHRLDLEQPSAGCVVDDYAMTEANTIDGTWSGIQITGNLLRASEMYGAASASFRRAKDHVTTRKQFGKPLIVNQALRHMLARDHMGLSSAQKSIAYAAAQIASNGADGLSANLIACSVAAETCSATVEHAIQLHGGMGFTWDLPLHRSLRRIRSHTGLFSAPAARLELAQILLSSNA